MGNICNTSIARTSHSRRKKIASSLAVTFLLFSLLAIVANSFQGLNVVTSSQILMADGNNGNKPGGG
jgi:hypothetical protein